MHTNLKRFGVVGAVVLTSLFTAPHIGAAQTTNGTTSDMMGGTTTVMVMKHLCNADIKNLTDFQALEAGKGPVAALANTVLNCPTTGLLGDEAMVGSVAAAREAFDFSITGEGMPTQTLADATYETHNLCESGINLDVNSDGTTSPATCLDTSHYNFTLPSTMNGEYAVTEISAPSDRHFGTMRFTPTELAMNNDSASLHAIDAADGKIHLRTEGDTDKSVMLHIYNFLNAPTVDTGTTTDDTSTSTDDTATTTDDTATTTDDVVVIDEDDDDTCHGHDMNGSPIWMTEGDDHGHDANGDDVQMEHCGTHNHNTGTPTDDDVVDEDTHDGMHMMCHGHDANGNMVMVTPGDDHGHDANGNDVQMDHCPSGHMDDVDNRKIEKIQRLQERMMKIQAQIIKLLEELLAGR